MIARRNPITLRLREIRLSRKIKQYELARRIGITQCALARWEGCTASPTWFNLLCWADALGAEIIVREKNEVD